MAGSINITYDAEGYLNEIVWDWTADGSGDVNGILTTEGARHRGIPLRVDFIPDSGGTQPDDNYDVVILDENSQDILRGNGANRSQTTTQYLSYADTTPPLPWMRRLELQVSNAGASNGGIVRLQYKEL